MCNRGGLVFNLGSVAVASSWAAGQHTADRGTSPVYVPWSPYPHTKKPGYQIQYQAICSVRRIANCGASSCMIPAPEADRSGVQTTITRYTMLGDSRLG